MKKKKHVVVAIDGPVGAGKSTVAKEVAKKLKLAYVDSGAMYRTVAWKWLQHRAQKFLPSSFSHSDIKKLAHIARVTMMEFKKNGDFEVDGVAVRHEIRTPEVSQAASMVAEVPQVREILVRKQKKMGKDVGDIVMDGRDIGTMVFPKTRHKFFLTASADERARRRHKELGEKGMDVPFHKVKEHLLRRDDMDKKRVVSPLRVAEDAKVVNSDGKTIEQVVKEIVSAVRNAGKPSGKIRKKRKT